MMFRCISLAWFLAAGLCPVDCPGVESLNLTSIINGHFDYKRKMNEIMDVIRLYG